MAVFRRGRTTDTTQEMTEVEAPARAGLTPVSDWQDLPVGEREPTGPTSPLFAGVCRYYHDCFSADSRGGTLTNILDKNQAEYLVFGDETELLATALKDRIDVPLSTGVTAQNAADVNRREKFLIYGSLFLVGRGPAEGAKRKGDLFCAPLLYWPAHIEQEGSQAFLTVDLEEQHVNFPLLASLIDAETDEQAQAYAETILGQVPSAPLDGAAIREFAAVVAELIPDLRTNDLEAFPELQTEEAVRALLESPVQLLCASAMALVRRPQEARGVLTELQIMGNTGEVSAPLAAVFSEDAPKPTRGKIRGKAKGALPDPIHEAPAEAPTRPILSGAELSFAQVKVLRHSEHRPLTLVIGPPGTGKSFTIAQLILDAVARGQTVLLSSKMNKAVDVVVEKLKPHLGSLTVVLRGGDRRYRDELKKFLDNLFDGTGAPPRPRPGEIEMLEERLRGADTELAQLDAEIAGLLEMELRWTRTHADFAATAAPAYNEEAAATIGAAELRRAAEEMRRLGARKAPVTGWLAGRKRDQMAAGLGAQLGIEESDVAGLESIARREQFGAEVRACEQRLTRSDEINALLTRHARLRADRGSLVGELLSARRRGALAEALRGNRRTL
ncbi:MAG: hypothetical protein IVW57_16190, partial [Ktedonobacterales bacterium]|nr:hypothetical protein [Ktedonobacterales bacterium]